MSNELAIPKNPSVADVFRFVDRAAALLTEMDAIDQAQNVKALAATLETALKTTQHQADRSRDAETAAQALKIRAERRISQLIALKRDAKELAQHGGDHLSNLSDRKVALLADIGVSYNEASMYAKLAAVDDLTFEKALDDTLTRSKKEPNVPFSRAAVIREIEKVQPKAATPKPKYKIPKARPAPVLPTVIRLGAQFERIHNAIVAARDMWADSGDLAPDDIALTVQEIDGEIALLQSFRDALTGVAAITDSAIAHLLGASDET